MAFEGSVCLTEKIKLLSTAEKSLQWYRAKKPLLI